MSSKTPTDLITPDAAADLKGRHVSRVYTWWRQGRIKKWIVDGKGYVSRGELEAMKMPHRGRHAREVVR